MDPVVQYLNERMLSHEVLLITSDCLLEVGVHLQGPATVRLDKAVPQFYFLLLQMLSSTFHAALHDSPACLLARFIRNTANAQLLSSDASP
jgi:hypothetical protein